jgi:hypothetical protein
VPNFVIGNRTPVNFETAYTGDTYLRRSFHMVGVNIYTLIGYNKDTNRVSNDLVVRYTPESGWIYRGSALKNSKEQKSIRSDGDAM